MSFDPLKLRHALHRIPELAYEEHKTKALLKARIEAIIAADPEGKRLFSLSEFRNSTGLLVTYQGGAEGAPYKLFRADMDALPLTEETGSMCSSEHHGTMHACGHDVHMAVLMGLISRVSSGHPKCNLMFLFQPAEEGQGGAQSILAEGLIQQYPVEAAFALHVGANMPVGAISSKAGIFFGIPQEFDLHFHGKASHVAFPEHGVNALDCALHFMSAMKKDIDELQKRERVIFHVGKMSAGRVRNVIADECVLEGTHRTLSMGIRDEVNRLIGLHARESAMAIGAKAEVDLLGTYDAVVNDEVLYGKLKSVCTTLNYRFEEAETVMTGEDFGFFTSMYPGLLFWLGSGSDHPLHSPRFLPQDECVAVGIDMMYALAIG